MTALSISRIDLFLDTSNTFRRETLFDILNKHNNRLRGILDGTNCLESLSEHPRTIVESSNASVLGQGIVNEEEFKKALDADYPNQPLDDSNPSDLDDVFSVDSESISSQSSIDAAQSLVTELYSLLRDDEVLARLYPLAFDAMSVRQFQKAFRGLMIQYCEDLSRESRGIDSTSHQRLTKQAASEAAKFIRKRLRQLITRLSREFGPMDDSRSQGFDALLKQSDLNGRAPVESYLQARHGLQLQGETSLDYSDADTSPDDLEEPKFAYINQFKRYLTSADAWATLRLDFEEAVKIASQKKLKTKATQTDERDYRVDSEASAEVSETTPSMSPLPFVIINGTAMIHRAYQWLQFLFKGQRLPEGKVGLRWTCRCGHSDTDFYEALAPGAVQNLASKLLEQSAVRRANTTPVSRSVISSFIEISRNAALKPFRGLKRLMQIRTQGLPTSQSTATSSGGVSGASSPVDPLFLLFCVDDSDYLSVPTYEHIDLSNVKSDQELFSILKQKYRQRKRGFGIALNVVRDIHFIEVVFSVSLNVLPSLQFGYDTENPS